MKLERKASEITIESIAKYLRINYTDLDSGEIDELAMMKDVAIAYILDQTGQKDIDVSPLFVIAIYILVQDMYFNRSLYIEKSNANEVVENIIFSKRVNFL